MYTSNLGKKSRFVYLIWARTPELLSNLGTKSRLVYLIWARNPDLTNYLFRCKVRAWLENGQDVDKADSYGNTGLLLAAEKGLVEVKIHGFPFLAKLSLTF